jgi:hypothetical protein
MSNTASHSKNHPGIVKTGGRGIIRGMTTIAAPPEPPKYKLVDPVQLSQGYFERQGFLAFHRTFRVVQERPEGIVVLNPEWERWLRNKKCASPN